MARREVPGIGHNQPPGPLDETETVPEHGRVKAGSKVMTIPEAGRELGYGRNRSYEMARNEEIPTIPTAGRKKMVPRAWVEAMLERTTEKALARSGLASDTGQVKSVDPKAATMTGPSSRGRANPEFEIGGFDEEGSTPTAGGGTPSE